MCLRQSSKWGGIRKLAGEMLFILEKNVRVTVLGKVAVNSNMASSIFNFPSSSSSENSTNSSPDLKISDPDISTEKITEPCSKMNCDNESSQKRSKVAYIFNQDLLKWSDLADKVRHRVRRYFFELKI